MQDRGFWVIILLKGKEVAGVKIQIAAPAKALMERLTSAGFAAYAAGGCVRDSILGRAPQDWDICTSATPEEMKVCFSDLRTVLTGEKYGTVTVLYEEGAFEITTFREETGYSDLRHPDGVRFVRSLEEDLARRDFTVNAMAADAAGNVTDCFGGLSDLRQGRIRCVGQAEQRFSEDALRMLRGLRFSAKLGFAIEEETAGAIHRGKEKLLCVAPERLKKELGGLLAGKWAVPVLREFSDVLCLLIPELRPCVGFCQHNYHHKLDVWEHSLAAVEACPEEEILRLAALLHDIGKPGVFFFDKNLLGHFYGHETVSGALCEKILRRLRYDKETVTRVQELVTCHGYPLLEGNERQLKRLLGKLGQAQLQRLLLLKRADALATKTAEPSRAEAEYSRHKALLQDILDRQLCVSLRQLKLSGGDVLALGVPKGPKVGQLLQEALRAVLEERLPNEEEALRQYAQKLWEDMENN